MEIVKIIRGTVSVEPGTLQNRYLEVPGSVTAPLSRVLSNATVSDSADVALFKCSGVYDQGDLDAHQTYVGEREVLFTYTSTASGPIDVDIELVFVDEVELPAVTYVGS